MFLKFLVSATAFFWYSLQALPNERSYDTIPYGRNVSKIRSYKEVVNINAVTKRGLFKVHQVGDKYLFEIPKLLFNRDFLVVNRILKAATEVRNIRNMLGYAGDLISENEIQFTQGPGDKVFIRRISYHYRSSDTSEDGLFRSVVNSDLQPIINAFDILAFAEDSSVVIDVTDVINGDNDLFFFDRGSKPALNLQSLEADKSYIIGIKSFPLNIEIQTLKTYKRPLGFIATYELNSSIVLLPEEKMKPRTADPRVGYFFERFYDFDANPQRLDKKSIITRWRLEPKDDEVELYLSGNLVEPKKPIIFYIDPATPKKWVPYLIQGVNDWQAAFEKAGFKNAIYAMKAPVDDSTWSVADARHNVIVYKPSHFQNASGPHIHDPRTGEILESHINWYHNVMELLQELYFVQAAAIDPRARKMLFDETLMGRLIRYVCSHEVGHALGLMHNFGASSTVPVKKLREKAWVEKNGICPSIMDYARFNYVAQPEDSISESGIFPKIGIYDEWAIEWGYRWFSDIDDPNKEKELLNNWIVDRVSNDVRLFFGSEKLSVDPRCQAEDLGDNAMEAGSYGIKNLKRVTRNLIDWTKSSSGTYNELTKMKEAVVNQYKKYVMYVVRNIGGIYNYNKTREQDGALIGFPDKSKQKAAMQFLKKELFETPIWLMDKEILYLTGDKGWYDILSIQKDVLSKLTSETTLGNLLYQQNYEPLSAYTINNLFDDLQSIIWEELKELKPINQYRRNLQKAYVHQVISLIQSPVNAVKSGSEKSIETWTVNTDIVSVAKANLVELRLVLKKASLQYKDKMSLMHLADVLSRLNLVLADM